MMSSSNEKNIITQLSATSSLAQNILNCVMKKKKANDTIPPSPDIAKKDFKI